MALYETIQASLDAITNWGANQTSPEGSPYLPWYGILLSEQSLSALDTAMTYYVGISDWVCVTILKYLAEQAGYTSTTIDDGIKTWLTAQTMFTNYALPKNYGSYFEIGYQMMLHGYRWAQELNHETTKWNLQSGYNGLKLCFDNAQATGKVFYECNPDTGLSLTSAGGRMYEANQLANCFYTLYKAGITAAKSDAIACWTWMNTYLWTDTSPAHFNYAVTTPNWVWDGPAEALFSFGRLWAVNQNDIPNFTRLINTHVENGYFTDYWNNKHCSIGATNYHYTVHHNAVTSQRRTAGHSLTTAFCHATYKITASTLKSQWIDMIRGTGGAHDTGWEAMLETAHAMYESSTKKFKFDSTDSIYTFKGTAWAVSVLIMLGISPTGTSPGALALPMETMCLGSCTHLNPRIFRWDYANKKLRIPVLAGELLFQFGTDCTYDFTTSGVFEITFNATYSAISSVAKISELPAEYVFLGPYKLKGTTRDSTGQIVGNCVVQLYRSSDKALIFESTSDSWGNYSFVVPDNLTEYFIRAYKDNTPHIFGTTDRNLIGS